MPDVFFVRILDYKLSNLNIDKEMIARASIVNGKKTFKMNQDSLDRVYVDYQYEHSRSTRPLCIKFFQRYLQTQMHTST